jgi:predicted ATPase
VLCNILTPKNSALNLRRCPASKIEGKKVYVITGSPGSGKTTTLECLKREGFHIVPEVARNIINEELEKDSEKLPWMNLDDFQRKVMKKQLEVEVRLPRDEIVFLDRGLPDGLAYYYLNDLQPPTELLKLSKGRYGGIFLLDPLPCYITDTIRREDEKTAARLCELLFKVYVKLGYGVTRIPATPVKERVKLIKQHL